MKDENLENIVINLYARGCSIRQISRLMNISRVRIRRILVSNTVYRDTTPKQVVKPKNKRLSKLDPYKSYIGELLDKYSDITGQRIYELLMEKGYDGKITILRDYLKTIRQVVSKTPLKMVETDPGQLASHDWSDYNITFTTGEKRKVTFFSFILCYSRRQYVSVVEDKKQKTLFRELNSAFIYMDGVTLEVRGDNQKPCVDHWEGGQPIFNPTYLRFASHYRFRPRTITPYKPHENLKIERPFYYLERSFLKGRQFRDLEDLKEQLRRWLIEVNDVRIHGTTKRRPIDMYIEEQPFLQPLPAIHFDTSDVVQRVVNQESCVQWKEYLYTVPKKYMFEVCTVRVTEDQLIVYSPSGEQLVVHPLAKPGQKERYVGLPEKPRNKPTMDIGDVISRLVSFGPEMAQYIELIKQYKGKSWGHQLRRLLALKVNFRTEDIMVAVRRAMKYKVFDAGTVESFLENNSEPRYSIKLSFKPRNSSDYGK
ncbi:MAG: IS21 family transposase [Bacteroidales bacterium]|nr:IS21 family transposase [Bacteroidales bacterium]